MKVTVSGDDLGDVIRKTEKALDTALARTLTLQQGKLFKANPKDTGRMAGSWAIGKNNPPDYIGDEGGEPPSYDGPITFDGTWYLSNNVPYASKIALDYTGTKAQKDWFTAIANQTGKVFSDQFKKSQPG